MTRYQLVPFGPAHIPHRVDWLSDARVRTGVFIRGELTRASTERWLTRARENPSRADFSLVDALGRPWVMCGITGIDEDAGRGELYMFGDPVAHGQGLGSHALTLLCEWAFEERNLNRIYLYTMGSNEAARRFYERAGFLPEGLLRQHARHEGAVEDRHIHGLLRTEWDVR